MWYRHLYMERSQDFMMKCENFIQKIRENPFANKKPVTTEKNVETGEMKRRDSASVQTKKVSDT